MTKRIHIRGVRRKAVDEDKLALAYLLLAKLIVEAERDAVQEDGNRLVGEQDEAA